MAKTKKVAKTKAVAKPDLSWVGQEKLMRAPATQADQRDRAMIMSVAKIYNMPALGVNVLANQPYINKDGLLYKLHEYFRVKQIKTEFIKMSLGKNEPAVVKATIIMKDGMEIEGIGEASVTNVKLEAVKNMLNQMAETRATNRAIRKAITLKLWTDVEKGLKKGNVSEDDKAIAIQAGTQSYEEMDNQAKPAPKVKEKVIVVDHLGQVKVRLATLGAKTEKEALKMLKEKTGLVWKDFKNITPRQAQMALGYLLNKK